MQELQQTQDNQWQETLWTDPDKWIAAAWHRVYNSPFRDKGMATRGEKYAEGKFANPPHPKDGYFLLECKDPRARKMLEFVIPTFYSKKPIRLIILVGNIVFGAYTGEQEVDWALVMRNTIR